MPSSPTGIGTTGATAGRPDGTACASSASSYARLRVELRRVGGRPATDTRRTRRSARSAASSALRRRPSSGRSARPRRPARHWAGCRRRRRARRSPSPTEWSRTRVPPTFMPCTPSSQPGDDVALAELELEGLVAILRAVELLAALVGGGRRRRASRCSAPRPASPAGLRRRCRRRGPRRPARRHPPRRRRAGDAAGEEETTMSCRRWQAAKNIRGSRASVRVIGIALRSPCGDDPPAGPSRSMGRGAHGPPQLGGDPSCLGVGEHRRGRGVDQVEALRLADEAPPCPRARPCRTADARRCGARAAARARCAPRWGSLSPDGPGTPRSVVRRPTRMIAAAMAKGIGSAVTTSGT